MQIDLYETHIKIVSDPSYIPIEYCQRLPDFDAPAFVGYREGAALLIADLRQAFEELGLTMPEPEWLCLPPNGAVDYYHYYTLGWTISIPRPDTISNTLGD